MTQLLPTNLEEVEGLLWVDGFPSTSLHPLRDRSPVGPETITCAEPKSAYRSTPSSIHQPKDAHTLGVFCGLPRRLSTKSTTTIWRSVPDTFSAMHRGSRLSISKDSQLIFSGKTSLPPASMCVRSSGRMPEGPPAAVTNEAPMTIRRSSLRTAVRRWVHL